MKYGGDATEILVRTLSSLSFFEFFQMSQRKTYQITGLFCAASIYLLRKKSIKEKTELTVTLTFVFGKYVDFRILKARFQPFLLDFCSFFYFLPLQEFNESRRFQKGHPTHMSQIRPCRIGFYCAKKSRKTCFEFFSKIEFSLKRIYISLNSEASNRVIRHHFKFVMQQLIENDAL